MNNGATIVLNKDAMNALFPEGSEARIKLASSAVKAMAEQSIKPGAIGAGVVEIIEEQRDKAVQQALAALHIGSRWDDFQLSDKFKETLRHNARVEVERQVNEAITKAVADIREQIEARVESIVNARIHDAVNKKVAEAVKKAVDAALAVKA